MDDESRINVFCSSILVGFLIGCFLGICLGIIVCNKESSDKYKKGQIDALTGKVKYHLVENNDGTKTWEEIQDIETYTEKE